ncbi:hypothetical protein ISN44_As02g002490 [Arabidopsis suecica]|uniref:Uncharacterized protein n=1 Tax=Arabidopsis suecica TaxID=45249 RepID=A0A8T2FZY4_ARASU|nr:hypothetical protein ISN44_As02g002490 [Arabidopsis suecica]
MDMSMREEKRPKVFDNHDWYFVWKTCVKRPLYPWRIIYCDDDSSSLFDPGEDKIYGTKLLGLSDNSYYMASSGNWLLMINLPSMESSVRGGKIRFEPSRYYNRQGKWGWFVLHPFVICSHTRKEMILGGTGMISMGHQLRCLGI